jgi:hypothetical protein
MTKPTTDSLTAKRSQTAMKLRKAMATQTAIATMTHWMIGLAKQTAMNLQTRAATGWPIVNSMKRRMMARD